MAIDILAAYKVLIPSQVIIEGIWGNNRASGFLAVDDVTFYDGVSIITTYDRHTTRLYRYFVIVKLSRSVQQSQSLL